jgi:hypothetical protein
MDRVELATKLQRVEKDIKAIEDNLAAIRSYYFEGGSLSVHIETSDYQAKGSTDSIKFSTELISEYLEKEKERLQDKSLAIIEEMSQGRVSNKSKLLDLDTLRGEESNR